MNILKDLQVLKSYVRQCIIYNGLATLNQYLELRWEKNIKVFSNGLSFVYDNILSIAMMALLIITGIFLTAKRRVYSSDVLAML